MRDKDAALLENVQVPDTTASEDEVIGELIATPEALVDCLELLDDECFSDAACLRLWRGMKGKWQRHEPIDAATMMPYCNQQRFVDIYGKGMAGSANPMVIASHATALKHLSVKRQTYFDLVGIARTFLTDDMETIQGKMEGAAKRISDATASGTDVLSFDDAANRYEGRLEEKRQKVLQGGSILIPTGFPSLDDYLSGGWDEGNLVILAARPSVGKTAVMLQMMRAAAAAGTPSLTFSLEMTNEALVKRMLLATGEVQQWELATMRDDSVFQKFDRGVARYSGLPIYMCDSARSLEAIKSRIIKMHALGRCGIAFVDYLGLMRGIMGRNMTQAQIVGYITSELKSLAKSLKIPIVLLCQLNRASVIGGERPPELSDLRDSGSIEQDADIVVMLQAVERLAENEPPRLKMWLRKNREGARNICIDLEANPSYTQFTETRI